MSIEKNFDVPLIADLALREKQIQQNYRPIIAVHKWFARRPGTLFRGLILSEFSPDPLRETFPRPNNLKGIRIGDPFMGGGTPLIEANRVGCDIIGYDINPMAYWIVRQEIEHLNIDAYRRGAKSLRNFLEAEIGHLYRTKCLVCGSTEAHVKYFLWVKVKTCSNCGKKIDLFPGYLIAENRRHPNNVFVCAACGNLSEVKDRKRPGECRSCNRPLLTSGVARNSRVICLDCQRMDFFPNPKSGAPVHRMFAIEYHCDHCKVHHKGRFFKKPDEEDIVKHSEAILRLEKIKPEFVLDDEIPPGDETNRLHRWGYKRYQEMFNERQLLGLELSCQAIARESDEKVRTALATNLSDLLRYQKMLCWYDNMAPTLIDFHIGEPTCSMN